MLAEILVDNIEKHIPLLAKILPVHSQIPILSHILVETEENGLFITATNLEFGARIKIPAKISEIGKVAIPGKYFLEILSSLPKEKFILKKEKEAVELQSRDSKFTLQTLPSEEFPKLFDNVSGERFIVDKKTIDSVFGKVILSISQEDSRPELTGICIARKEGREEIVATDGYRLSLYLNNDKSNAEEGLMILSSKLIHEIVALKTEGILYLEKTTNQAIFKTEDVVLVGRLIAGRYPQYEKILPKNFKTKVILDTNRFYQETKLVSIFARENANILSLKIVDGAVLLFAKSSGVGESNAQLEAEQDGDDTEISFNARYLLDFLKQCDGDRVVMELNSSLEPARFTDSANIGYFHIIMPVRIQG